MEQEDHRDSERPPGRQRMEIIQNALGFEVSQLFHEHITATHETIVRCNKQNRKLSQLHDWLLPMLMNGRAYIVSKDEG